ncbi:MAG: sigma-70 family RNA polymerase sigma factor [Pseudomonadota bacterium]
MDRLLRIVPPTAKGKSEDPRAADAALVVGLRAMERWAMPALVERHGAHVRRMLMRVLDARDAESADLFQEVMVRAWEGIDDLHDPGALKPWLTQIAIFTARGVIRRRRRQRWLSFFDTLPEPKVVWAGPDLQEAAGCVYRIFERMPVDERIPFALRMLEGMDLDATAAACSMSVATVRRRLVKAERRFFKMARQYDALQPWLDVR